MSTTQTEIVRTHKALGIASCAIGIAAFALEIMLVWAIFDIADLDLPMDQVQLRVGILLLLLALLSMVAIGLGIAGLFNARSKKLLPVLGIILGLAAIVPVVLLSLYGLTLR